MKNDDIIIIGADNDEAKRTALNLARNLGAKVVAIIVPMPEPEISIGMLKHKLLQPFDRNCTKTATHPEIIRNIKGKNYQKSMQRKGR